MSVRALWKPLAMYGEGSLSLSVSRALQRPMEGGAAEGAMVDIVAGTRFGAAPFKVEFKAGGGTIRVEGDAPVFDSNDGLAVRMTGNSAGSAV